MSLKRSLKLAVKQLLSIPIINGPLVGLLRQPVITDFLPVNYLVRVPALGIADVTVTESLRLHLYLASICRR